MEDDDNVKQHSIVRRPCSHCAQLCSPSAKACPKCGEPLIPISQTSSERTNRALIDELNTEISFIKQLQKCIGKGIPEVSKLKRGQCGFTRQSNKVTGLSLFRCKLEYIPQEVYQLTHLKKLYLRRNKLTEIPGAISALNRLQEFDLSINSIKKIPNSFGLLKNIRLLNISSNKLRVLPETMSNLTSMETLILNNNQLSSIPQEIMELPSLKRLDKGGNLLLYETPVRKGKLSKIKKKQVQKSLIDF